MSGDATVLLWWFLFGGTHVLGSVAPVRGFLIEKLGTQGFKGAYSLHSRRSYRSVGSTQLTNKSVS